MTSVAATAAPPPISIPGSFAVSPSGSATYTIPIQIPPGIAGVEPTLTLAYDSQGGNGPLGLGWRLSGLSVIARCPKTPLQDGGPPKVVNYTSEDRFCLDGQRLMSYAGNYGENGSEYRTELESFSKVMSYGTAAGGGPLYFVVKTKAGLTMEFGNTTDSRIEVAQKTPQVVRVWALNKVSDTKGNAFTVTYTKDTTNSVFNGGFAPARIDYTSNAGTGLAAANSVVFNYDFTRPDTNFVYQGGYSITNRSRITSIVTQNAGANVLTYTPTYELTQPDQRSRITAWSLCASGGSCLPATTFTWQFGSRAFALSSAYSATLEDTYISSSGSTMGTQLIDVNDDGRPDIVQLFNSTNSDYGGSSRKRIYLNTPSGFVYNATWSATLVDTWFSGSTISDMGTRMVDLNGDGRPDIIQLYRPSSGTYGGVPQKRVYLNTGSGFALDSTYTNSLPDMYFTGGDSTNLGTRLVDINGDGRPDIIQLYRPSSGTYGGVPQKRVYLNTGTAFVLSSSYSSSLVDTYIASGGNPNMGTQVLDINGDGLPDIIQLFYAQGGGDYNGANQKRIYLNNGTSFAYNATYSATLTDTYLAGVEIHDMGTRIADLNGDGLPDIMQLYVPSAGDYGGNPQKRVYLNTGTGFTYSTSYSASLVDTYFSSASVGMGTQLLDVNGDGRPDLVQLFMSNSGDYNGVPQKRVYLNTGTKFVADTAIVAGLPDVYFQSNNSSDMGTEFADINGDGLLDMIQLYLAPSGEYQGVPQKRVLLNAGGVASSAGRYVATVNNGVGLTTTPIFGTLVDPTVYTKGSGAVSPRVDMQPPMTVVKTVISPDGVGGLRTGSYTYGGLRAEIGARRGSLGFEWQQSQDDSTGLVARSYFRQDWPYIGSPYRTGKGTSAANWNNLSLSSTLYSFSAASSGQAAGTECADTALTGQAAACAAANIAVGKRYFTYPQQIDEQGSDYSGTTNTNGTFVAMPRTRTRNELVDAYGNVGKVTTLTLNADGSATDYSKTVNNTYFNDTTNWYLGRLLTSSVTAAGPDVPSPVVRGTGGLGPAPSPNLPPQLLQVILNLLLDD